MSNGSLSIARRIIWFEGRTPRTYWRRFSILLAMAVIMATMGLIRNSGAVVIAAMLIAPLMTPILGVAAAMVSARFGRAMRLLAGVAVAAAASVLLSYAMMFVADVPRGIIIPNEVRGRTDPGIEELIVALVAGLAGAFVQIHRDEISMLPGAAIGVSLVPPLSAAGILLYFGDPESAYYALRLVDRARQQRLKRYSASMIASLVVLLAVSLQLGTKTVERFRESRFEQNSAAAVRKWAGDDPVEIIRLDVNVPNKFVELWLIVDVPHTSGESILRPNDMIPATLEDVELSDVLRDIFGPDYQVSVRYQFRFAGVIDLRTNQVDEAPPVDQEDGEMSE